MSRRLEAIQAERRKICEQIQSCESIIKPYNAKKAEFYNHGDRMPLISHFLKNIKVKRNV